MSTARIDELRSKFDENPRRYFAPLANEYRKAGDLAQAIALCREHLPKQPGHMSGYIVFGQALFENGELAEAQDVFQSALELDPENLIALRHLGDIARTRGDAGAARRWYERVLDADPRNDDISALLATLAQRHTPRAATPVAAMPAVQEEPTAYGVDDDPFSAPDSPAWHTPSFLTPLASAAVPAEPEAGRPEVGWADAKAEGAVDAGAEDLLDLDFSAEALSAVNADATDVTYSDDDAADAEAAGQVAGYSNAADAVADDDEYAARGETNSADEVVGLESDALTAALGAFAAHDPIEVASELPMEDTEPAAWAPRSVADESEIIADSHDAADVEDEPFARADSNASHEENTSAAAAPFAYPSESFDDDDAFEEGLVAQEWPDADALSGRLFSPARGVTPISSEAVSDAIGETADEMNVESPVESSREASVESSAEDSVDVASDEAVEATADEAVEVVQYEATAEAELEDFVESERDDDVDEDPPVSAADIPWLSVAEEEREADEELALADAEPQAGEPTAELATEGAYDEELELGAAEAELLQAELVEAGHAETEHAETGHAETGHAEAEHTETGHVTAESAEVETVAVEHGTSDDLQAEEPVDEELTPAPDSPAFVTETMAELLVAQGFIDRAITVYEELVARRPYDAVLTSRLTELHAMKQTDSDSEAPQKVTPAPMPAWSATPIRGGTPVRSATPFRSLTPIRGATPISSATPVRSATPLRSATPIASPALPLVAPPARRTARELFATLAGMRVARRTPAFGTATVAMPTPADGLASLFGETAFPHDDRSAHSLASAFGSGEGVEPGPSLFASSGTDDASRFGAASASTQSSPVSPPHASGSAFSFDRFFPDPATTSASAVTASDSSGVSQTPASGVASGSGDAEQSAGPSSAGADLAQFSHWLKGLSNS